MNHKWIKLACYFLCCAVLIFVTGCESDDNADQTSTLNNTTDNETDNNTDDTTIDQGVAADELPLDLIVWLDTDVGEWEITSELSVSLSSKYITYDQDGTSKWPATYINGGNVSGNAWVFIYKDGLWYGSTAEWMRPGQTVKSRYHVNGAHMKKYNHFPSSWQPTPGVTYGFMVSGLVRSSHRNARERTQIVLMKWE